MPFRTRNVRTPAGVTTMRAFGGVRLEVQGRECFCDVTEIADECPVLIGQVPLELLDFVVDPQGRRLIGNPEHGGEQMIGDLLNGSRRARPIGAGIAHFTAELRVFDERASVVGWIIR